MADPRLTCARNNSYYMEKLTTKEEEVLTYVWQLNRPCGPRDVVECYPEPRPHVNTVATSFQSLEKKGYLTHESRGRGFAYSPVVTRADYGRRTLGKVIDHFFAGSYLSVVSAFVKDRHVSKEELDRLLRELQDKH